jgi:hypothetical protein
MGDAIYCLVDGSGRVFTKDRAESYAEVAASCGLDEHESQKYRFDLTSRRFLVDRGTPASDVAAHSYLSSHLFRNIGTPERLMHFAEDGHVPKEVLGRLLEVEGRQAYLEACTDIEKKYTAECAARNDPCLESGCSIDQAGGEICLQPLLKAGIDYHKACAAEWIKLFRNPENRIEAWKN